jgi:DNA processing protein
MADPPVCLFVRGRIHATDSPAVAIVGARYASSGGIAFARALARDLAARGVTIVSGLALGIDAAAHRGALDAGGFTLAVLAGGLDRPTPPSHRDLARKIAVSGGLASEFPPGTSPLPINFPRRNRILAALASIVVVVEGRERSGARSTIDHALAMGREVAAVPRDPLHEGSRLPNMLLQSGASPVTAAGDVIALLERQGRAIERSGPHPHLQEALLRHLDASRDLEYLVSRLEKEAGEILACLGSLEAAGEIRRLPGMRFRRVTAGALS